MRVAMLGVSHWHAGFHADAATSAGAEIAAVVAFLLSEESAYLTGEVVSVDGGAAIMSTVRSSGGAGAWDFAALDRRTYRRPAGLGEQEKEE